MAILFEELRYINDYMFSVSSSYVNLATYTNTHDYPVKIKQVWLRLGTGNGTFEDTDGSWGTGNGNMIKAWLAFYKNGVHIATSPEDVSAATGGVEVIKQVTRIPNTYTPDNSQCTLYGFTSFHSGAEVLVNPGETIKIMITGGTFTIDYRGVLCIDKDARRSTPAFGVCAWIEPQLVTVTFNPTGGTVSPTSVQVTPGLTYPQATGNQLPTPVREGYSCLGWYTAQTGGSLVTKNTVINQNVTWYAHWEIKSNYSLTYNVNGGTGTVPSQQTNITYGTHLAVASANITKTNSVFASWNTRSDGTGIDYYPGNQIVINDNITLYAKWTPKDISLVYKYDAATHTWNIIDYPPIRIYDENNQQWNDLPAYIYSNGQWVKMGEST